MLGVEHDLALLGGEADVTPLVAVVEGTRQLSPVFADQAAHKPTDAQAQGVISDPLLVTRFQPLLLMVDIAQHAEVIVQASKDRKQAIGLGLGGFQPILSALALPAFGAPLARRFVAGVGVLANDPFPFSCAVHRRGVGVDVMGCRRFHRRRAQCVGIVAAALLIGLHRPGVGGRDQFGHHLLSIGQRWAMRRLQLVGHRAQGHVAHVRAALGTAVAQRLAVFRGQGVLAVEHPGVMDLFQRQARQGAVQHERVIVLQRLLAEQTIGCDGVALERALVLPQVKITCAQAAGRHGMAVAGNARRAAGMGRLFFGQRIAHRHHEQFRLTGRAGRYGAVDIFVGHRPGGSVSSCQSIKHFQLVCTHAGCPFRPVLVVGEIA
ncbi:hypothetical protein D3C76_935440 [compost metagenome]